MADEKKCNEEGKEYVPPKIDEWKSLDSVMESASGL